MTTGPKAAGTGARTATAALGHTSALTGSWTTAAASVLTGAYPHAGHSHPAPSPELLATLAGRHSAGLDLGRLGHWEEACEVHRAVAAAREHALGPDHPDTLASRYAVGYALSRTGPAGGRCASWAGPPTAGSVSWGPTTPTP